MLYELNQGLATSIVTGFFLKKLFFFNFLNKKKFFLKSFKVFFECLSLEINVFLKMSKFKNQREKKDRF